MATKIQILEQQQKELTDQQIASTFLKKGMLKGIPTFHGKKGENIFGWLWLVEDSFLVHNVGRSSMVIQAAGFLRDAAQDWYVLRRAEGTATGQFPWPSFSVFKKEMMHKFEEP